MSDFNSDVERATRKIGCFTEFKVSKIINISIIINYNNDNLL